MFWRRFILSLIVTDVSEMTTAEHLHACTEFRQQYTVCGGEIFVGETLEANHVGLPLPRRSDASESHLLPVVLLYWPEIGQ
jgi:hypothetical protein